ncbi:2-amino-4-hydroxy-6-hydroxymethyldihydropteridine diphosphokinase [Sessilibacter sp. MAH1]
MNTAYIGLGANLNNPIAQLTSAVKQLSEHLSIEVLECSKVYDSDPVGPAQPNYTNAALKISTELSAPELLTVLQTVESDHGRVRIERWGARTLDLDLLLFNNQVIQSDFLTVPHPRLHERNFVVFPLLDIDNNLALPDGTPLNLLKKNLGNAGLRQLDNISLLNF